MNTNMFSRCIFSSKFTFYIVIAKYVIYVVFALLSCSDTQY